MRKFLAQQGPLFVVLVELCCPCFLIGRNQRNGQIVKAKAQKNPRPQGPNELGQIDRVPELDQPIPMHNLGREKGQKIMPKINARIGE